MKTNIKKTACPSLADHIFVSPRLIHLNMFAKNSQFTVSSLLPQLLSISFSGLRSSWAWATNAKRETSINCALNKVYQDQVYQHQFPVRAFSREICKISDTDSVG